MRPKKDQYTSFGVVSDDYSKAQDAYIEQLEDVREYANHKWDCNAVLEQRDCDCGYIDTINELYR